MKLKRAICILIACAPIAGCGTSMETHAQRAGIDLTRPHRLLALSQSNIREMHGSVSGAFLFAIGGGGGSVSSTVKRYVGFIVSGDRGTVLQLQYEAKSVDYRLDANAEIPTVTFHRRSSGTWETDRSATANLEDEWVTNYVTITLSPGDFSRDIQVLQYVGAAG